MRLMQWWLLPAVLVALSGSFVLAQEAEKPTEKKAEEGPEELKEEDKPAKPDEEAEPDKATVGKKAPGFTLKNADGKEVKLSDYAGKIVVIEWVNLDCPWCKKHYEGKDELVKQQKKVREEGGEWLLICSSASGKQGNFDAETLKTRLQKVGLEGATYLIDADGAVGKKYDAKTTPHTFVIDKKGVLRYAGALDNLPKQSRGKVEPVNYVANALEAIKADKEVAEKEVKPYG